MSHYICDNNCLIVLDMEPNLLFFWSKEPNLYTRILETFYGISPFYQGLYYPGARQQYTPDASGSVQVRSATGADRDK